MELGRPLKRAMTQYHSHFFCNYRDFCDFNYLKNAFTLTFALTTR